MTIFSFPPDKGNVGTAAYLDVFGSIHTVLSKLRKEVRHPGRLRAGATCQGYQEYIRTTGWCVEKVVWADATQSVSMRHCVESGRICATRNRL